MNQLIQQLKKILRLTGKRTNIDVVYYVKSGWWINLGTIIISFLSLITYICLSHFLSKEVFGLYQYLISLSVIIGSFTLTGMNSAVARSVANSYNGALVEATRVQLKWSLLPFIISLFISGYYIFNGNTQVAIGSLIIGVLIPILNTFNTYGAFLHGKKDFKNAFLLGMRWNIPYYVSIIIVSIYFQSALFLLLAGLLSQTISLILVYRKTLKIYEPDNKTDPSMVSYSKHLTVMNFFSSLANQIDSILTFHYLGAAQLAIYSFATAIPEKFSTLLKFIPTTLYPKFADRTYKEENNKKVVKKTVYVMILSAICAAIYILIAPHIFNLFFPKYVESILYSQIYSLIIISSFSGIFSTILTAQKQIGKMYIVNIGLPIFSTLIQFIGILFYGLWGLIISKIIVSFISLVTLIIMTTQKFLRQRADYAL